MDVIAVTQARSRLEKAEKSLSSLRAATNYGEAEEAWTDFLLAASTIYSKLEQGSKGDGKSEVWFAQKKKERRDDPLLLYLHRARNSDEHGIEAVVRRFNGGKEIFGAPVPYGERVALKIQKVDPVTNQPVGETFDGFYSSATIKLIRVHDRRFDDYCDPPQIHLGEKITYFEEPHDVGVIGLGYLKTLVAEAEGLV